MRKSIRKSFGGYANQRSDNIINRLFSKPYAYKVDIMRILSGFSRSPNNMLVFNS